MMSDKHPVRAMCDIRDLGLFYVVFSFPEKSNPPVFDKCDWYVLVLTSEFFTFSVIFQDPVVTIVHSLFMSIIISTLVQSHILSPIWVYRQCFLHIKSAWDLAYIPLLQNKLSLSTLSLPEF